MPVGWSHHWTRPTELDRETFAAAIRDVRALVGMSADVLAGFEGKGCPIVDEEHIVFNGRRPAHCEPFEIARIEFDRRGRSVIHSFCKTEQLPYDLYVQAALIILRHHVGEMLCVTSDGNETSWQEARNLVSKKFGYGQDFRLSIQSES